VKIDNKPMMSEKEITIIDNILSSGKPKRCLEWGSGYSTLYFSEHKNVKSWLSIEHNGHYVSYLQERANDKVQTLWVLEGLSYADCVQRSNVRFDFILIDGLDREKCLQNALNILDDNGQILLHDSGRAEYQDFIFRYNGKILCEGEEPYRGFYKHRGLAVFTQ